MKTSKNNKENQEAKDWQEILEAIESIDGIYQELDQKRIQQADITKPFIDRITEWDELVEDILLAKETSTKSIDRQVIKHELGNTIWALLSVSNQLETLKKLDDDFNNEFNDKLN